MNVNNSCLLFTPFYLLIIMLFQAISDAIKSSIWNFRFSFCTFAKASNICPENYEWLVIALNFIRNLLTDRFCFEFSLNQWLTTILHQIKYTLEGEKKMRQYHTIKYSENKHLFYSLIRSRVDFKPGWYVCITLIWFFAEALNFRGIKFKFEPNSIFPLN